MRARSVALLALMTSVAAACGTAPTGTPTSDPRVTSSAGPAVTAVPTAAPSTAPASSPATGDLGPILEAAEATIAEDTVSIEQAIEFDGSSRVPDGTSATLVGGTAFSKPTKLAVEADFAELGLGEFDMIVDDQLIYMRGTIVESIGAGKWLLVDMRSDDPRAAGFRSLATGQNDASLLLYFLYGAEEPVERLPDEMLDGEPMQVYSMPADLDAAAARAPAEARTALRANVTALRASGMGTTVQAEAWIGADGLVHRVAYLYAIGSAIGGGTLLTTCVFSGFGVPLDLGIPDEADVVRLEDVPAPGG